MWSQQPIGGKENFKGQIEPDAQGGKTTTVEVAICFSLGLIGWRGGSKFFRPRTLRCKAKPEQYRFTFGVKLQMAP